MLVKKICCIYRKEFIFKFRYCFHYVSKGSEDCIIIHSNKVKWNQKRKKSYLFKFEIEGAKPKRDILIVFSKRGTNKTSLKLMYLQKNRNLLMN